MPGFGDILGAGILSGLFASGPPEAPKAPSNIPGVGAIVTANMAAAFFAEGTGAAEQQAQAQAQAAAPRGPSIGQVLLAEVFTPGPGDAPKQPGVDILGSVRQAATIAFTQEAAVQAAGTMVDAHEQSGPGVLGRGWGVTKGVVKGLWNFGAGALQARGEEKRTKETLEANKQIAQLTMDVNASAAAVEKAKAEANRQAAGAQAQMRWTARAQGDAQERTAAAQAAANRATADAQADLFEKTERAKAWGEEQKTQQFLRRLRFTDPDLYRAAMNNMAGASPDTASAAPGAGDPPPTDPAATGGTAASGPPVDAQFRVL